MHIRSNKKRKDTISLYSPIGEDKEGNEISLCDIIEDPSPSISDSIIKEEQINKLYDALKVLNKREYQIITRRYGLNNNLIETQQEVADSLKISRSYVSRIEKRALTKMYLYLKDE
jgi:RNA polymerase sporulation-specific sigma factor